MREHDPPSLASWSRQPNGIGSHMQNTTLNDQPQRTISYPKGDRIAFVVGIVVTLFLLSFFSWRMVRNVTRDRALGPVPASTPMPPAR